MRVGVSTFWSSVSLSDGVVELHLTPAVFGHGQSLPLGVQRMNLILDVIQIILMLLLSSDIFTQSAVEFTVGLEPDLSHVNS